MTEVITQQTQTSPGQAAAQVAAVKAPRGPRDGFVRGGSERMSALLFLSPTLIIVSVFIFFPIVFSFYLSFHEWNMFGGGQELVGLQNYARLMKSAEFWQVFGTTALYTIVTVPINMAVALAAAMFLDKKLAGKKLLRAAFFTPVIVSWVAAAVIWRWVFHPNIGLLNYVFSMIGLPAVNWVNDPVAALISMMIVGVWKTFGINMILFAAGLAGIPQHYYEAAEIDGAGPWSKFYRITLPLLSPTTLFILVLSIIGSFQVFDLVWVLTHGGPLGATKVIVFYLYEQAFQYFNMGYASAIAYVLLALLFILTMVQFRYFRGKGAGGVA